MDEMGKVDSVGRTTASRQDGVVLTLDMPDGERRRFPIGEAGGGEAFFAAWDALPEDCRQRHIERMYAEAESSNGPLTVAFELEGRVILVPKVSLQVAANPDD